MRQEETKHMRQEKTIDYTTRDKTTDIERREDRRRYQIKKGQ